MESICFEDGTLLRIEDLALAKLFKHIQTEPTSNEAGGILIGKQVVGREEYYLCDISEPTTLDTCSRYSFVRSKISAQKVIDKKWKESKGIENYLGEWHTHPEINPHPSFTDRNLIKQVIADNSNKYKKVFLIIVGMNKSLYIGIANSDISNEISMSMIRSFYEKLWLI